MARRPLSVVLPTRDRPEMLDGALASLTTALSADDELVVVDSASTDRAVRDVALRHGATYIRCEIPGASKARNAGWRAAANDVIAFVDDDARVAPDWADAIVATFDRLPDVAFLTGRVGEPPGGEVSERPVAVTDKVEPFPLDRDAVANLGQSNNMAIRREAIVAVGGFDEMLGPGSPLGAIAEDVDLFDRLILADLPGRYEPSVHAWHLQWRDRRALLKLDWRYGKGSGFRLAKLVRADRNRARRVGRIVIWDWGLRGALLDLKHRYEFSAATNFLRVLGVVTGFARALLLPVRDGHFATDR